MVLLHSLRPDESQAVLVEGMDDGDAERVVSIQWPGQVPV